MEEIVESKVYLVSDVFAFKTTLIHNLTKDNILNKLNKYLIERVQFIWLDKRDDCQFLLFR